MWEPDEAEEDSAAGGGPRGRAGSGERTRRTPRGIYARRFRDGSSKDAEPVRWLGGSRDASPGADGALLAARRALVRGALSESDTRAGGRLAGDRARRRHAHRGADRIGENARG